MHWGPTTCQTLDCKENAVYVAGDAQLIDTWMVREWTGITVHLFYLAT